MEQDPAHGAPSARPRLAALAALLLGALLLIVALAPQGASGEQAGSKLRRLQAGLLDAGSSHTCALLAGGRVRCWGSGDEGRLGYGNTNKIGDDETPGSVGPVNLGRKAVAITAGTNHTCALLAGGRVRCWGYNFEGRLGYGNTDEIGDDETPGSVGPVKLGRRAVAISAGGSHTCALLEGGVVRCWGQGFYGQLGYGNKNDIGDDETPGSVGQVDLGGKAVAISAGTTHTCALLVGGKVRCWGYGGDGRLGYANKKNIGDDETPGSVGPVKLGGKAVAISAGESHTCALLKNGRVRCWGYGGTGGLGYANTNSIGDDETPASVGLVNLGRKAVAISVGSHTCALLEGGRVRCWGAGTYGRLGYGNTNSIGDNETPGSVGPVDLGPGRRAVAISAGSFHTCSLLKGGAVRCWGAGFSGQLGYGNTNSIGDNETPGGFGPVHLGGKLSGAVGDLSLRAGAGRARARVGQRLVLAVKLRNSGPDRAPGVVVRLRLPRKLKLLSARPGKGTYNRRRRNWRIGRVAAGGAPRLTLVVAVRRNGRIAGSASVKHSGVPDPDSKPGRGTAAEDDFARFRIRARSKKGL